MNNIKTNSITSPFWIPYLVFFAGSFIYFGFFDNYIFLPQEKASLFIFSYDFLHENLHQPGGLLIWLGKFFSTFYYYPAAGAIIISSILALISISVSKIIFILSGHKSRIIPLLIGISLFYLQTDFHFLLFNSLGLLLQLALFRIVLKHLSFFKSWTAVILFPSWFYATGSFTWIFLLLITFYFAFDKEKKRWIQLIVLWGLGFIIIYMSKEFLFFQSGKTLLTFPFSDRNLSSEQILFFTIAGIISILPLISKIKFRLPGKPGISDFSGTLITSIVMVILLVIVGIRQFDYKAKQYFHIEKLFYHYKFDEIIAYNTSHPTSNILTIFLNNIALCETGKLDDQLFHFRQSPDGKTLFLKWEMVNEILNRGGYFYYTIGMINEAHRWAFENMVMNGQTPEGLKMLIKTELINGNNQVASSYIDVLKRTLFYRKEALAFEKLLSKAVAVTADKGIALKRQNRLKNDFFSITDNPYINIEMILASDSLNRQAFEYKMAFLLLTKNYEGISHELPQFEKLGFSRLPVHVEEAALALAVSNKGRLPDIGNLQISKNTEFRWNQYLTVLRQYDNNVRSAEPELRKRFGDTFWYWVFYR